MSRRLKDLAGPPKPEPAKLEKEDKHPKKMAFVHKLYAMLNNPALGKLLWWTRNDADGTFAVNPTSDFAMALTQYFKHGNVSSFVRQLHMYGFHKVNDKVSGDERNDNVWEFRHSSGLFKKGDELNLLLIKRRQSSTSLRNNTIEFMQMQQQVHQRQHLMQPHLQNIPQPPAPQLHLPQGHYPYELSRTIVNSQSALNSVNDNLSHDLAKTNMDVLKFSDTLPKLEPVIQKIDDNNFKRIEDLKLRFQMRLQNIQHRDPAPPHLPPVNEQYKQPSQYPPMQPQLPLQIHLPPFSHVLHDDHHLQQPIHFQPFSTPQYVTHQGPVVRRSGSIIDPLALVPNDTKNIRKYNPGVPDEHSKPPTIRNNTISRGPVHSGPGPNVSPFLPSSPPIHFQTAKASYSDYYKPKLSLSSQQPPELRKSIIAIHREKEGELVGSLSSASTSQSIFSNQSSISSMGSNRSSSVNSIMHIINPKDTEHHGPEPTPETHLPKKVSVSSLLDITAEDTPVSTAADSCGSSDTLTKYLKDEEADVNSRKRVHSGSSSEEETQDNPRKDRSTDAKEEDRTLEEEQAKRKLG